jgi:hypothetical protein
MLEEEKKSIEKQVIASLRKIEVLTSQRERSGELPLPAGGMLTDSTESKNKDIFQFAKRTSQNLPPDDWEIWAGNFTDPNNPNNTDVLGYAAKDYALWVGKNNGAGVFDFDFKARSRRSKLPRSQKKQDNWIFLVGNFFTGRKFADVVGYARWDNALYVGENNGLGTFHFGDGISLPRNDNWRFWTGNFAGNGLTDVLGYAPSDRTLWVFENDGIGHLNVTVDAANRPKPWKTLIEESYWNLYVGNFTGHGVTDHPLTDVVGYSPSDNTLWVGENTKSEFVFRCWAKVSDNRPDDWKFWVGNFRGQQDKQGNDLMDLVGYCNHELWVGENTGLGFLFRHGAHMSDNQPYNWEFFKGDFVGDFFARVDKHGKVHNTSIPKPHLLGYMPNETGVLWLGRNMGTFYFGKQRCGAVPNPGGSWKITPGLFVSSKRDDILCYHKEDNTLTLGINTGLTQEGYAWPLSGCPGQEIEFFVSGEASETVEVYKHTTFYKDPGRQFKDKKIGDVYSRKVTSIVFDPEIQNTVDDPWRNGAGWNQSFPIRVPTDWTSGIYSARLTHAHPKREDTWNITFVVKPLPGDHSSDVAVIANINTWLAYNAWGGRSKYTDPPAAYSSFLRPAPDTNPDPVPDDPDTYHQARGELWVLGWLENEKRPPHVYTDLDFHNGLINEGGYRKLVLSTHPEYWSVEMYDNLRKFLEDGGSLIYLGGNGIYEIGKYYDKFTGMDDFTGMVFLNGCECVSRETQLFRVQGRSERFLLGVALANTDVDGLPYAVNDEHQNHHLLAGIPFNKAFGYKYFGENGRNTGKGKNGMASGWETDVSGTDGVPVKILARAWVFPSLHMSAHWGTGAEMTYYRHPGQGSVFSVGSIAFGGSIPVDSNIQEILRRVLNEPNPAPLEGRERAPRLRKPRRMRRPAARKPRRGSRRFAST